MRIDSRFEPPQMPAPRNKDASVSAPGQDGAVEEGRTDERPTEAVAEVHASDLDFAREMQTRAAYLEAARTSSSVADFLEATPDL